MSSTESGVDPRVETILARLQKALQPASCEVEDESAQHAGHAGAASGGGHYRVRLVSAVFEGKNRLIRHRLVYDCLADMMHKEIHALAVTAIAPSEIVN
ncbi:BolA protein [Herbaspirillum sp. Sphag1AN]|jgi:BolA family transcriptional regulator, general stress-responsive regulator|uniref:BolA family protein n=1 Tax=unclassified Herbaspirillum TaxID=2624150 RepID=UPI0016176DF5|nr:MULTISPECIES: BolA family protein [unclassified Herbaspirillum]MBB3212134.1 BolA protein [Herbaspirillum sp. Sphag1AN]MBB3244032.1 BolA protein [Herbaspirillum sp. Sphag64]